MRRHCCGPLSAASDAMRKGRPLLLRRQPRPAMCASSATAKGLPDALTLLAEHPELRHRVRCVFSWAGAAGGSYAADEMYKKIEALGLATTVDAVARLPRAMFRGSTRRALAGLADSDIDGAIRDLTTARQAAFFKEHGRTLDGLSIPFFQFIGATSVWKVPLFQIREFLKLQKYDPIMTCS